MESIKVRDTESFITAARKIHGYNFDYSKAVYTRSCEKVVLTCTQGHEFQIRANGHLSGNGCVICAKINASTRNVKTQADFLESAKRTHGLKYNYEKVRYDRENVPVEILCPSGHTFWQTPNSHYSGRGCSECSNIKRSKDKQYSKEQWTLKALKLHNNLYDYSQTNYTASKDKINILCKVCETEFWMTGNNHMSGKGCPACAVSGFNPTSTGSLYFAKCGDISKIGITNKTPEFRLKQISSSFGAEFTMIKSWEFSQGRTALDLETHLLKILRASYSSPDCKFDGSTECFHNLDLYAVEEIIRIRTGEDHASY